MVNITVKTLDSQNHSFTVDEELTVKEFKDQTAEKVQVTAETQRLIYCGRVLQDDKKIKDYNLDGKVVHLVQKAPPTTTSSGTSTTSSRASHHTQAGSRPMPNPSLPPPPSSALVRLTVARQMLEGAGQSLSRIATLPGPDVNLELNVEAMGVEGGPPMGSGGISSLEATIEIPNFPQFFNSGAFTSTPNPNGQGQHSNQNNSGQEPPSVRFDVSGLTQAAVSAALSGTMSATEALGVSASSAAPTTTPSQSFSQEEEPAPVGRGSPYNPMGRGSYRGRVAPRGSFGFRLPPTEPPRYVRSAASAPRNPGEEPRTARYPRVAVFADVLEDLERIQTEINPHVTRLRQLLRDDPVLAPGDELRNVQHLFRQVSEAMHYQAHALHALSDLVVEWSRPPPREVRARPFLMQYGILQAGIPVQISSSGPVPVPQSQSPAEAAPSRPTSTPAQTESPAPAMSGNATAPTSTGSGQSGFNFHMGHAPGGPMIVMEVRPPMFHVEGGPGSHMQADHGSMMGGIMGPFPMNPGGGQAFDRFLPCHSRHLLNGQGRRTSNGSSGAFASISVSSGMMPQRPPTTATAGTTTTNAPPPTTTTTPTTGSGAAPSRSSGRLMEQFLEELRRTGETTGDTAAGSVLSNEAFVQLVQGVSNEVVGLLSGQPTHQTVADFIRQLPDFSFTEGQSVVYDLIMTVSSHLTFGDLVSLMFGRAQVLNPFHSTLQDFVRTRMLGPEGFTEPEISRAVGNLLAEIQPHLEAAQSEARVRPNVDFVATVLRCLQRKLHSLLELIGTPGENPQFGPLVLTLVRESLMHLCTLCLLMFEDGPVSLERVSLVYMRRLMEGLHPTVQQWTMDTSLTQLRNFVSQIPPYPNLREVEAEILSEEAGRLWCSEFEKSRLEASQAAQPTQAHSAEDSQMEVDSEVLEVNQIKEEATPLAATPTTAAACGAGAEASTGGVRRRRTWEKTPEALQEEAEPALDMVLGSEAWHRAVPEDWVPIISRDVRRQRRMPQQVPLSPAYLAAMPPKRRKIYLDAQQQSKSEASSSGNKD